MEDASLLGGRGCSHRFGRGERNFWPISDAGGEASGFFMRWKRVHYTGEPSDRRYAYSARRVDSEALPAPPVMTGAERTE